MFLVQLMVAPLRRLGVNRPTPIDKVGSPESILSSIGPFITGALNCAHHTQDHLSSSCTIMGLQAQLLTMLWGFHAWFCRTVLRDYTSMLCLLVTQMKPSCWPSTIAWGLQASVGEPLFSHDHAAPCKRRDRSGRGGCSGQEDSGSGRPDGVLSILHTSGTPCTA